MVYPVSWTAVCYVTVIALFIKKVGVIRPNFGGSGPPIPQWLRPWPGARERATLTRARRMYPAGLLVPMMRVCLLLWRRRSVSSLVLARVRTHLRRGAGRLMQTVDEIGERISRTSRHHRRRQDTCHLRVSTAK